MPDSEDISRPMDPRDDPKIDILVPKWVTKEQRAEIKKRTQVLLSDILKEKAANIIASDGDKSPGGP